MIGILALQGAYQAHAEQLARLNSKSCFVREPDKLKECVGLIVPGGESSTLLRLLSIDKHWFEGLEQFYQSGKAIWGTCAGAILLASRVINPEQEALGFMDIVIERNGYGRQLQSCIAVGETEVGTGEMVFIRAPRILRVAPTVKVLAYHQADPVALEQGSCLVTSFHPELSVDLSWHQYFLTKCFARGAPSIFQS